MIKRLRERQVAYTLRNPWNRLSKHAEEVKRVKKLVKLLLLEKKISLLWLNVKTIRSTNTGNETKPGFVSSYCKLGSRNLQIESIREIILQLKLSSILY